MTKVIKFAPGLQPIIKHNPGTHDQKTHGSWSEGISSELETWNPKDPIPAGPRNAGGVTEKFWDNWEHGVDGDQFVDLYRQYAGEMLGIPVPKSEKDVGGSENYLTQRGFGASSTSAVRNQTEAALNAIANGKPQPTLYRGMAASNPESQALLNQFTSLEQGDTIDMPLVSTTRSLGVAQWYAVDRSYAPNDTKVILKIQEGAKGISVKPEKSWYPSDHETIVSGKFEVVGKTKVTVPYWSRSAVQGNSFQDRDGKTVYRIADPNDPSWGGKSDSESASRYKTLVNGINSGNFSKIETPTLKYTNDRNPGGVKEDTNRIVVNAWTRKEPKTFTVIEVKLVEPHVVKKASDKGLTFDKLFSTIPFIRDEEVSKHGEHNQKTHGSWANGSEVVEDINEWNKAELAKFSSPDSHEAQMLDQLLSQRLAGFDGREFHKAVNDYQTMLGYTANEALRDPNIGEGQVQYIIDGMDAAIKAAPGLSSETTVYRGIKGNGLDFFEKLNPGDIYQDKGFTSTTLDTDIATKFSVQGSMYQGIVMRMKLPAGTKGLYPTGITGLTSLSSREAEFVLPRDSKFKILNNQGKVWDVELVND